FEEVLLRKIMLAGSDRVSLVNYNDEAYFDVQNTTDPAVIANKIVRKGRGGTATYNAVISAARWLKKQPESPDYRKLLFLFTDGDVDNASTTSLEGAVSDIEEAGIPVFVVLPKSSKQLPEVSRLTEIAEKSGGDVYFVSEKDNGDNAFAPLREELQSENLI